MLHVQSVVDDGNLDQSGDVVDDEDDEGEDDEEDDEDEDEDGEDDDVHHGG